MFNRIVNIYIIFFVTLFSKSYCIVPWPDEKSETKIIGGQPVGSIEDIPYICILKLTQRLTGNRYMCSGIILNETCVLTAAHCVQGMVRADIRIGTMVLDSGGKTFSSTDLLAHPGYNSQTMINDVAIIKISEGMGLDGKTAKAVKMMTIPRKLPGGTLARVSGWGVKEDGKISSVLRYVVLPVVDIDKCRELYKAANQDVDPMSMLCAGDIVNGGKDSCQADSGGPLVEEDTKMLYGIVSHGISCADPRYPGVNFNVSYGLEWILHNKFESKGIIEYIINIVTGLIKT